MGSRPRSRTICLLERRGRSRRRTRTRRRARSRPRRRSSSTTGPTDMRLFTKRDDRARGQALVEFSLVVVPFLVILMACVDLGRAIYQMNGTSEAAREIARAVSVHPYSRCTIGSCDLGSSAEVQGVVSTQRNLVPSLHVSPSTDITCVEPQTDGSDTVVADGTCGKNVDPDYVKVTLRSQFTPVTPIVMIFGSHTFTSTSRIKWP